MRSRLLEWCVLAALVVVGVPAFAEDEPPAPPKKDAAAESPAAVVDFLPYVAALYEDMQAHAKAPGRAGPGGELHTAWEQNLKRRSRRLAARARDLTKSSLWVFDEDGEHALGLVPGQWGTAVRRLASLYTELGSARKGYDRIRVSPDRAIALWDRRNPPPSTLGLTPAGVALRRIRAEIATHRFLKKVVPHWLLRELDRLVLAEQIELEYRVELRRRWSEERARAHAEIRARVEETRALVIAAQKRLDDQIAGIRELTAELQEAEEGRLRAILGARPAEDPIQAAALAQLAMMARGRNEALRFRDARTSRWGSLVRQGWMVPRSALLALLAKGEKAAAKPAEGTGAGR